ncbi:MAG: hypothetical protein A2381_00880 [Bdellovibrionales bacterium RIFOXYB1_FULL_37_110]|nr:MAG: hypothetical protein A2417_01735 [Bdellovibrionales bacterium RIFOXYC1_FULL_37_79]OFZ58774.1 MAG: hypothetical protein A2381_00880 [Bdellovibrionales bacterium RIFOXYB1_FULL_37_110]OFZ64773.1 MAG: hypothetical protein A2577_06880 [Bdellovibrionales bacterium RIFOXYD1_FULL_36_51]
MITLIQPPVYKQVKGLQIQTPNPPLGLAYVAAWLKENKYPYTVIDALGEGLENIRKHPFRNDLMIQGLENEEIIAQIPIDTKYIGISVLFSFIWPLTKKLIFDIKVARPDIKIIAGGEHITAVPEYCLREGGIDICVLGEGENTLLQLLKALDANEDLHSCSGLGIIDREGKYLETSGVVRELEIDKFPWPDWDSFPIEKYIDNAQLNGVYRGRSISLLPTRGCPFTCTFCSSPRMYGSKWIFRDPKDIADEMQYYQKKYKVTNFDCQDLTAVVNKNKMIELCKEIINRKMNITWQLPSGTRSESFDKELVDYLYRAGLKNLAFAPESGDKEILKQVKKKVDLEKFEDAARTCVKRGIVTGVFIVIGFPNDTHESLKKTLKLVRKMAFLGIHDCTVSKFVPYPGSELFFELQAEGKITFNNKFFESPIDFYSEQSNSFCKNLSEKELYNWMLKLFMNFYILSFLTHPFRTFKICMKALLTRREETRYAKFLTDKVYLRTKWLYKGFTYQCNKKFRKSKLHL